MSHPLVIGSVRLDTPFAQAAMAGYSDLALRRLARRFGASYTLSEVVLDKLVLLPGKNQRRFLQVAPDDHPIGGQLMGSNPDEFGPAAHLMAQAGYDIIDINFGCPVKKVLGRGRGGFLLSVPKTALEIVKRVYDAVGPDRPVTVKMRRGQDDSAQSERDFFTILDGALAMGVAAVTVHARTVKQRYQGPSDWRFLTRVKRHVGNSVVLGSGDLFTAKACQRMMEETGVDGVTIARGCIGYPWIFGECRALAAGKALPPPPSIQQQREAIEVHWAEVQRVFGPQRGARLMRKFGIKYSEHHPDAGAVRTAFIAVEGGDDFEAVVRLWYDPNRDWPPPRRRADSGHLIAAGATP